MRRIINSWANPISLLVIGLGVGWLIGLSISPVVQVLVGALVALLGSLVGALAGLEPRDSDTKPALEKQDADASSEIPSSAFSAGKLPRITPLPFAITVVGIVLGSAAGLYVRSNDILGYDPSLQRRRWRAAGLNEPDVERKLLVYRRASSSPDSMPDSESYNAENTGRGTGLFSDDVSEKEALLSLPGALLRKELIKKNDPRLNVVLDVCSEDQCLRAIVRELL